MRIRLECQINEQRSEMKDVKELGQVIFLFPPIVRHKQAANSDVYKAWTDHLDLTVWFLKHLDTISVLSMAESSHFSKKPGSMLSFLLSNAVCKLNQYRVMVIIFFISVLGGVEASVLFKLYMPYYSTLGIPS